MPEKEENTQNYRVESPLAKWPGSIELPDPDLFSGRMWSDWRKAIDATEATELNRIYAYAGADLIKKHGKWAIEGVTLAAFQGWQHKPDDELMKFVSWVGKQMNRYMEIITDPKE